MGFFLKQTHGIIVTDIFFCNSNSTEELFSKVIVIDPKVIDNSLLLFYYISCKQNIRFVFMLFQLLVIVNNVQTS